LQQQSIAYRIFVIEQEPGDLFNRGSLMNVGFLEASAVQKWDCFIFHDIDLLPKDQNTTYRCYDMPFHMANAINKFGYKLPYSEYTGGVLAMTNEQFRKTNGYSNKFWGWGGEDDDMTYRIEKKGFRVFRLAEEVSRYDMLLHDHRKSEEDKDR
jgi:predicted glycosyltransferase involved in capsule biosynthesis